MTADETAAALVACGEALYDLATCNVPRACARRAWMSSPKVGDFVMIEHVMRSTAPIERVGRLLCREWREFEARDLADEDYEGAEPLGRVVWDIETLDGRTVSWDNVLVLRLPSPDATDATPAR